MLIRDLAAQIFFVINSIKKTVCVLKYGAIHLSPKVIFLNLTHKKTYFGFYVGY